MNIASRGIGTVKNGKVYLNKILTYDLVADPGFTNAQFEIFNEARIKRQSRKEKIERIFSKNNE